MTEKENDRVVGCKRKVVENKDEAGGFRNG